MLDINKKNRIDIILFLRVDACFFGLNREGILLKFSNKVQVLAASVSGS